MKRRIQKLISVALAFVLALSCFVISASAEAFTSVPTVYIHGYGSPVFEDATSTDNMIFPITIPDDYANQVLEKARKPIAKGMMLGQWDDFHDLVIDEVTNIYGPIALDHNGEASNGTGSPYAYNGGAVPNRVQEDGTYNLRDYWFDFDWRLDPFVLAEKLNLYINAVLEATGAEKVNLIGRCYGGNIVLAYLVEYGFSKIQSICFYATGFYGFEPIGALFSGEMEVDPDTLTAYFDSSGRHEFVGEDENPTYDLLMSLLQFLNAAKTLKVGKAVLESYLIPEFKKHILPEVLRNTFGTIPGIWSFVGNEYYEEAKNVMFAGQEEEWAGLIEKTDRYHNRVMARVDEILLDAVNAGVRVYNFVKYGYLIIPIVSNGDMMSDDTVSTANSSLGATTATVYGTLSDEYIAGVKAENGGKYLSPDEQIDASTCLLPDHTWFFKHLYHPLNPDAVEVMMAELFNYDGYATVFDFEQYPQYMDYDISSDTIAPLQADETNPPQKPKYSFFKSFFSFMRHLFRILKEKIFKR